MDFTLADLLIIQEAPVVSAGPNWLNIGMQDPEWNKCLLVVHNQASGQKISRWITAVDQTCKITVDANFVTVPTVPDASNPDGSGCLVSIYLLRRS